MEELLANPHGWLRFTTSLDGKTLYLKYKWTHPAHLRNTYVMAVVAPYQLGLGLQILLGKVNDVEAGTRHPTPDKGYDGYQ
jgi:hypothetical protein